MSPLDAAFGRLGRAVVALLHPSLADRAASARDSDEEGRVAAEVDRLALMLAR